MSNVSQVDTGGVGSFYLGLRALFFQPTRHHLHPMAGNSFLTEFIRTVEERFSDDHSNMVMSDWIVRNTHLKKKPFNFKGYEFQRQIIDDLHPDLCCIKISQIGLSESQFRKFFGFLRRNVGTTGIYTMPTDVMRDRISQTRVKPMIDNDDVFNPAGVEKPVRQKGLYQIDQSFGYMTGSTEGDATSISADLLMHDEIDLTDQQMIALFQSRLQGSQYRITQAFSTPTYVGYGIDALFTNSDQHEYLYKCPHCRHSQIPIFAPQFVCLPGLVADIEDLSTLSQEQIHSIDVDNAYWRCEKCFKPLDLTDPSLREWVARFPGRLSRGYRVRPTTVSTITIPYVLQRLQNAIRLDNLKGFRNTVLGDADNDANARLSEADIRAAMGSPADAEIPSYTPCFIGIDVGITCHVILSTLETTVFFRQVPNTQLVQFVTDLRQRYNIVAGCIDRYPDTSLSEQIKSISDGTIIPIHYATAPNAPTIKEVIDIDESISHWNAHRTKAIDAAAQLVRKRNMKLQGFGNLAGVIVTHLRNMVRVEHPDTLPVWNKIGTEEDHFFHALTYVGLAMKAAETDFLNHGRDRRSQCFVFGVGSSTPGGLTPSDLNRNTGAGQLLGTP